MGDIESTEHEQRPALKAVSVAIVNITRPGVETECNLHFMNGRMTSYWLHVTSHFTTTPGPPPLESSTQLFRWNMIEVAAEYLCTGCAFLSRQREREEKSRSW